MNKGLYVDAFVVYTDSETGGHNPSGVLRQYRAKQGKANAKLAVVAMIANWYSIADPNDAGTIDLVGFDSATPQLLAEFIAGRI